MERARKQFEEMVVDCFMHVIEVGHDIENFQTLKFRCQTNYNRHRLIHTIHTHPNIGAEVSNIYAN